MVMEEVTEKKCSTCGKVKRLDSFGKNKRNKDGKDGMCKICKNTYQVKNRQERYDYDRTSSAAKMSGLTKRDWCKTYEFLISIGYDVTKDIHLQFSERYGLLYKKRPGRNKISYTYEDCLDCSNQTNPLTD
jgi:hypothetical protein